MASLGHNELTRSVWIMVQVYNPNIKAIMIYLDARVYQIIIP